MNLKKMNKGLDFLREKYGAKSGEITIKDGNCYVGATPLLPGWGRVTRFRSAYTLPLIWARTGR